MSESSSPTISRQWQLVNRPTGWPTEDDVRFVSVELPPLADGEVRVQNDFVSVDPYMRGRMNDVPSYIPPFVLGETMTGEAVGTVIDSRADGFPVGTVVSHFLGWRDVSQGASAEFRALKVVPGVATSAFLGVLGVTSFTAWIGLTEIAELKAGDAVFVSGAAGAVGSMVGQIAKLHGASRVIGSAGSAEKVELLISKYGFDAAFNYRDGRISRQLQAAAPDGIDVYFDNVGGEHLEAAIFALNTHGRVAVCGAISMYNDEGAPVGPRNLAMLISKSLTLKGFTVPGLMRHYPAFLAEIAPLVASRQLVWDETVVDGIENAFDAWLRLMRGENIGKMVVRTS